MYKYMKCRAHLNLAGLSVNPQEAGSGVGDPSNISMNLYTLIHIYTYMYMCIYTYIYIYSVKHTSTSLVSLNPGGAGRERRQKSYQYRRGGGGVRFGVFMGYNYNFHCIRLKSYNSQPGYTKWDTRTHALGTTPAKRRAEKQR